MPDPAAVKAMFARIARRYDLANRLLSGGTDRRWRRRLLAAVRRAGPQVVLDLATGSGDVALALGRALPDSAEITGMDFCPPMLDEAEAKRRRAGGLDHVRFQFGDGMALPLADASVDAVTIAFGLRNMADRARALREMRRVLRPPNGRLFVLEFSQPAPWFRPIYYFYLRHLLPFLAGWITGERGAYDYLGETIGTFPGREALARELRDAGFAAVTATALTFGIVALHEASI
jgi:demethylmenaquinone methyltransferase/2-methoxy-6-polyprenyl-1,4-benzoquinol methylase